MSPLIFSDRVRIVYWYSLSFCSPLWLFFSVSPTFWWFYILSSLSNALARGRRIGDAISMYWSSTEATTTQRGHPTRRRVRRKQRSDTHTLYVTPVYDDAVTYMWYLYLCWHKNNEGVIDNSAQFGVIRGGDRATQQLSSVWSWETLCGFVEPIWTTANRKRTT